MKRWQDWAADAVSLNTPRPSFLGVALRFRVSQRDESATEAQANDVPFTPVWWWWNKDEDEYVMTMWEIER
jgi:hypothetical protein